MNVDLKQIGIGVGAMLIGALPAFFVIFNALFSDGGSAGERAFTFVLTAVVYAVFTAPFGWFVPDAAWRWGLWMCAPAVVLVGWYTTREPERIGLHLAYLAIALASACAAGWGAGELARRRTP